ncbi:D-erythrose-4-phosphate dehydrogenase [Mycolicibacterium aubagnense]
MNTPELANWNTQEALAEAMIPLVGNLHRTTGVTVLLHSRSLVNKSVISILRTHRFARQIAGEELSVVETFPFLEAVAALDLGPAKIDLGLLVHAYRADERGLSVADFVADALSEVTGDNKGKLQGPRDVVLYGFGRIGRLVARLLVEKAGSGCGLNIRAVVVRSGGADDLKKRASLLRRDSVHGHFNGTIKVDKENNLLIANGNVIKFIYANDPSEVDYTQYGINDAILIDNTGKWRDRAGLEQHLRPGISKVVLTAPGKGDVPNIVHGVNHLGQDVNQRDLLVCVVHHQCDRAATQGDGREVRHHPWPRRDSPLVHQRPEPSGQLPQGRPSRPFGAAEPHDHRDRRGLGRRQGAARAQGQDHG